MKQRFFEANGIKFMQMAETGVPIQNYIWSEVKKLWVLIYDDFYNDFEFIEIKNTI